MQQIVIIGNGISGVSTAIELRKWTNDKITIISDESDFFFARTALMYIFMGKLNKNDIFPYPKDFWVKNKIELKRALVKNIDFDEKKIYFSIQSSDSPQLKRGGELSFDKLVLALGSKPNKLPILHSNILGIQNFYSLSDVAKIKTDIQGVARVCIVGGGLIGVELAEMLLSEGVEVHYIIREKQFGENFLPQEEAILVTEHLRSKGIFLYVEEEIEAIIKDENGRVSCLKTRKGLEILCGFLAVAIGVSPNKDLVRLPQGNMLGRAKPEFVLGQGGIKLNRGILVNEYLETSIQDVFAVGDCAELLTPPSLYKSIEANWYVGKMMGEVAARNIVGQKVPFAPKIYFNSAKFFELDYQIYGKVSPQTQAEFQQFFWKSAKKNIALRFEFETDTLKFCGVHSIGIRLRQNTLESWLLEGRTIDFVIENLEQADFSPEFSYKYFNEVLSLYNQLFGKNIKPKPKTNFLFKLFSIR